MINELSYLIALCKDTSNDPMDTCYKLYFINNSNEEINSLKVFIEAEEKECDEFVASDYLKEYSKLKPKSILELKYMDEMDFGIDLNINTLIHTGKNSFERKININNVFCNEELESQDIPVLNRNGHIIYCS